MLLIDRGFKRLTGFLLTALLSLWCCATLANYDLLDIDTGTAEQQSVLFAQGSVYVFSTLKRGSRNLKIMNLSKLADAEDLSVSPSELSDSVIFADEINTPSGTKIALIHRDRASFVASDETILSFTSLYNAPVFQSIPHFDAFRDLNGDGLDDFLIPTFEGYQVATQRPDGSFTQPQTLEAKPLMDMSYNSHPWYQAKNIFVTDMTGDDREDLVFWQDDEFRIYPQSNLGTFSEKPALSPSRVVLDYDSVDGMSVRFSNEDQSDKIVNVIHSLEDYDGDGITDLMAMRVKSEGVFRKTTTFSLHLGEFDSNFTSDSFSPVVLFAGEPHSIVQSNGIQYDMVPRDLDSDGDLDLMVSSVELGVGKIIGALLTSSIKIDLGFYVMDERMFSQKPATTRNITLTFDLSSGEYWLPAVQLIDRDLDGRLDLFLQESESELRIFDGDLSGRVFATKGETLDSPLPKDPDFIRQLDVNLDGIDDLVMQIPPPLGEKAGHRAIILLSNP